MQTGACEAAGKAGAWPPKWTGCLCSLAHIVCETSDTCIGEVLGPNTLRSFAGLVSGWVSAGAQPASCRTSLVGQSTALRGGAGGSVWIPWFGMVCIGEAHSAHSLPNSTLT